MKGTNVSIVSKGRQSEPEAGPGLLRMQIAATRQSLRSDIHGSSLKVLRARRVGGATVIVLSTCAFIVYWLVGGATLRVLSTNT